MSAIVNGTTTRQLDRPAATNESVTEKDVAELPKLARLLQRILTDLSDLKRRFWPREIDFEDVSVDNTGTTKYRFEHGFNGRVRWWPVDAETAAPALKRHADTDANTLVLVSSATCTVTVRVQEAG